MTTPIADRRWNLIHHNDPAAGRCHNKACRWMIVHWQEKEVHVARTLEAARTYISENPGGPS